MPEGPEIRRAADKVARRLVGSSLTSVKLAYPPNLGVWSESSVNASVESVTSRGKALLMRFDNGLTLYSHSQLYGRWTINRVSTKVRWNRSLRAEFVSEGLCREAMVRDGRRDYPHKGRGGPPIHLQTGPRHTG